MAITIHSSSYGPFLDLTPKCPLGSKCTLPYLFRFQKNHKKILNRSHIRFQWKEENLFYMMGWFTHTWELSIFDYGS